MADELTKFSGTWKMDRSEKTEELLTALGWEAETRQKAMSVKPTHQITVEAGKITILIDAEFIKKTEEFKLGEEFETDNFGRKAKVIASMEGGKLVLNQVSPESAETKLPKLTRAITADGEMCIEAILDGIVCISYLKKQ